MPHMTDERVRAGLAREEDLSLLNEVSINMAGVSLGDAHPLRHL